MPVLLIRATPGDTAARPVGGIFWESPDIFFVSGVAPADAPDVPAGVLGGAARAGADNTIYAQVWNVGNASATGVAVEFYWFNPTLIFSDAGAHLIGRTAIQLQGHSSTIVKCPNPWQPQFVNGGHECLVVRASQGAVDPLGQPPWNASQNRHVGQRNVHVTSAAEGAGRATVQIDVGPLFGRRAHITVSRTQAEHMPRLVRRKVVGDGHHVAFTIPDTYPDHDEVNVYRIVASQNGETLGGYTVVIVGSRPSSHQGTECRESGITITRTMP